MPIFRLGQIYDNKLRNAKGYNDYEIDLKRRRVVLLKDGTRISFTKLEFLTRGVFDLLTTIDDFLASELTRTLKTNKMFGILDVTLRYDVSTPVGEHLVPVGNSLPEVIDLSRNCNVSPVDI
jgi:hypothetical protein